MMGIFNFRFKKEVKNSLEREVKNNVSEKRNKRSFVTFRPMGGFGDVRLDFAKSDLLDCFKKISSRMGNIVYSSKREFMVDKEIFDFLQKNTLQIITRLFYKGFIIIDTKEIDFVDANRKIEQGGKVEFNLLDTEIVFVSETLRSMGQTDFQFLKDKIKYLNTVNSSDYNLIENYGAMGMVTPESDGVIGQELDDEAIEVLQEKYRKSYGVSVGKWSLMFMPRPTKYQKIDLPISQLQLSEKRLYLLKAIYSYFGIPKELSTYFENVKYANRNEAELDMYANVVASYANIFLQIAELIYNKKRTYLPFLMDNEFWFDFVGVLALEESKSKEQENARNEILFWKDILTSLPEYSETANLRISNLIENL